MTSSNVDVPNPRTGDDRLQPGGGMIDWSRWFVVLALVIGLSSAFISPAFRGPDELTQLARTTLIGRGYLIPPPQHAHPGRYRVDGCVMAYSSVSFWKLLADKPTHWSDQFENMHCSRPTDPRAVNPRWGSNTEVNPPVAYLPALVGYRLGRASGFTAWRLYGPRVTTLLAFITLVWLAIRKLPWGKPFLVAVALLPGVVQLAGNVSADPITNGLVFLAVAMTLQFIDRAQRDGPTASTAELFGYGAVLVALALTKTAAVPILGVALLVPSAAFGSLKRRIRTIGPMLSLAIGLAAAWALGVVSHLSVAIYPGADSIKGTAWIRGHPIDFAVSVFRAWSDPTEMRHVASEIVTTVLSDRLAPLPPIGLVILVIAIPFVVRLANPEVGWFRRLCHRLLRRPADIPEPGLVRSSRQRKGEMIVAAVIFVVGFVLVEVGSSISANPPGAAKAKWVQARYFVPYLPLLLFGARRAVTVSRRHELLTAVLPITLLVAVNVWWLVSMAQRFYI